MKILLHAALHVNRHALEDARARDRERAAGRVRGPLHGIPIAVKDNVHTTDMPTTGGALAFAGYVPPYEATLVANLRAAGAIVIAKTGMTELANWIAGDPTPMPANYNAIGGFGFNPYQSQGAIRGQALMVVRCSPPAGRAQESEPPPVSGRPTSAPKHRDRSSARRTRTCWSASSRPSVA
ncbi:MAG: amidase family protein [Vicinamibacterales bacterium]